MLRKLFGIDKEDQLIFVTPLEGKLLELTDVPDEVFAKKIMGDGFAIDPTNGEVVAPVDGKVTMLFPTKHAIGITSKGGLEILIHIGIETVNLDGEGFEMLVKEGQTIKAGQPLVRADFEFIKENAKSIITPIVFTNLKEGQRLEFKAGAQVSRGDHGVYSIIE